MSWNTKQEALIIQALKSKPKDQTVLTQSLLTGKNKKQFVGKSVNAVISKARSISYEALTNDVLLVMPPPAPKPKKKTAAQIRKEMFSTLPRMTATQKTSKAVIDAVKEARLAIAKREAAAKKAKATRAKNKAKK